MSDLYIKKVYTQINHGGSGIIERVLLSNGKHAARKTFDPTNLDKLEDKSLDKFRKRFIKEVLIQQSINSELIMPVLFHDLSGDKPWFVMPLADRDYANEIQLAKDEKRNPEGIADILNALEHLHNLGYTHRDVKPQNILFQDGKWKLSDFGLITNKATFLTGFSTSEGDHGGTAMYMAPEQFNDFKHVSALADIFSFGAILHDIFDGGKRTPYRCLSSTPGQIGWIIQKCTDEDPRRRFQSVAELRSVLLTVLTKEHLSTDSKASTLIIQLEKFKNWTDKEFEQFCFATKRLTNPTPVLLELGKERIAELLKLDEYHWKQLMHIYLTWIAKVEFEYDFCDVLIGRIQRINELSKDIELKYNCVYAAATLAVRHNRWYVMHRVIWMIGVDMDDKLAQRLEIELQIDQELKKQLKDCLRVISRTARDCHPLLVKHLL